MENVAPTTKDLSKYLTHSHDTILEVIRQAQRKIDILKEQEAKWNDLQAKIKDNLQKVDVHRNSETNYQAENVVKFRAGRKKFVTTKSILLRWPNTYFEGLLGSGNWKPDEKGTEFKTHFNLQDITLLT